MPTLGEVAAALEGLYDPAWAQSWDAVGLVCGDPDAPVRRVLLAVDPVAVTVEESVALGADLLLTHHPLLLRGVNSVAADTYKGRLLHRLITSGVALYTAHTNADVALPGVSDALAARFGLQATRPLAAVTGEPLDKVVTFVPSDAVEQLIDALAAAGAGAIGDYGRCAWLTTGTGTFLPAASASPTIGQPGVIEQVPETRVEMVLSRHRRDEVVRAMLSTHPYEEPAFDVVELAPLPDGRGFGRVGELRQPMTVRAFLALAAEVLPATASGFRAAGDPARVIRTVAVAGGAGDAHLADAARAGADAYLTADLRHHPVSEHIESGGPVLVSAAHWATEHPWLYDAADRLRDRLDDTVETVCVPAGHRCLEPAPAVLEGVIERAVNAQLDDQLRLLDLQNIDSAIARLGHRRATLPELAQIAELTSDQQRLRDDAVRGQTEVGDLDREQRKLELDVEQVRARADRDVQRMAVSTSAKEVESLQHEVESLARRQSDLEDQLLELMERRDDAGKQLDAVTAQLDSTSAALEVAGAGRDKAFAEIDAGVVEQRAQRAVTAATLPADLLALYERIRASSGGTGAARLFRHRCEGCHLELSGGDLAAVRNAPADEVVHCEECGRILIRTSESGL